MLIQVATRHGSISDATEERVIEKAEKLTRFFERLTAIEIVIDLKDENAPRVDVKVSAEHKHDFVTHVCSNNVIAGMETAVHKLEQQLRKYKEKVQERHRNPDARRQAAMPEVDAEIDAEIDTEIDVEIDAEIEE